MPTAESEQLNFLDYFELLRDVGVIDDLGLDVERMLDMSFEEWEALGTYLGRGNSAFRWAIGDWINFGEAAHPEKYTQAMEATGLSQSTLRSYAWVAASIARVRRRTDVSWSNHEAIASLPAEEQRRWLNLIHKGGWSVERTREERRTAELAADEEDAGALSGSERVTVREAARRVWISSSRDGDAFRVPLETMLALGRSLGEPV